MAASPDPRGDRPAELGFHGDRYLLRLVDRLAAQVDLFVETGANLGTTLGYVARSFPSLEALSCEPEPRACATARAHLPHRDRLELHQETSQAFLGRLAARPELFERPCLFWLDAHGYGFDWPLAEELAFISRRWRSGFVLIDDFEVPGRPEFGFDRYGEQVCSFDYVRSALDPAWRHRLYYPAYSEHTSPYHPLRGWGLIQFGPGPLPRLDFEPELAEVLALDPSERRTPPASPAPARPAPADPALGATRRAPAARRPEARAAEAPAGPMVRRDRLDDLLTLVGLEAPVVVDGGAHRGHTFHELRRRSAGARIHSVEPIPEHAAELARLAAADPRLTVHPVALGEADGEVEFLVTAKSDASSRLAPSGLARRLQGEHVALARRLRVPLRRLDGLVSEPIDALKLDLQGGELEALAGLGVRLAEEVRVVLTEVEFAPLYEGQPLFGELDRFLRERGFELFNLYELWTAPGGRLTSGDALYVNRRWYEPA